MRGSVSFRTGRYTIRNSVTAAKDQTYALYNLTQFQLSKTLMPIGDYAKDEVRKIAEGPWSHRGKEEGQHGDLLCAG